MKLFAAMPTRKSLGKQAHVAAMYAFLAIEQQAGDAVNQCAGYT
jgi:hypothetical protein